MKDVVPLEPERRWVPVQEPVQEPVLVLVLVQYLP